MSTPGKPFFNLLCRTCMHQLAESSYDASNKLDQHWQSIFDTIAEVGSMRIDQLLSITIPQIVEVEENDEMPKKICSKCFEKLLSLHRFQELCVQTDQKLRTLITKRNYDLKMAITGSALEDEIATKDLVATEDFIAINEHRIECQSVSALPENQVDPLQGFIEVKSEPSEDKQSNVLNSVEEFVDNPNDEYIGKCKDFSLEAVYQQVSIPDGETQRVYSEKPDKKVTKKVCDICDKMLCSSFSLKRHKRIYHSTETSNKSVHRLAPDNHSSVSAKAKAFTEESPLLSANPEIPTKASNVDFFANKPCDEVSNVYKGCERMRSSVSKRSEVFTAEEGNEQIILAETHILLNEKTDKTPPKFVCDICERILSSTFSLKRHKKLCHSVENAKEPLHRFASAKRSTFYSMRNKPCDDESNVEYIVAKTIHSTASAKNEVLTVEAEDERIILDDVKTPTVHNEKTNKMSPRKVCDVYQRMLSSTFKLKRHKMMYHSTEKEMEHVKQLPCDLSSRVSANKEMLTVENEGDIVTKDPCTAKESNGEYNPDKEMHSTIAAKNEALTTETELEQVTLAVGHTQRLQNEKMYKKIPKTCDICKKTLSSMYSLKRHKLIYHSTETPARKVRLWYTRDGSSQIVRNKKLKKNCDICKKILSSAYALNRHKRIYHSTEHSNNTLKQYPCEFCPKVLKSSLSLSVHLRRHTVERPYLCAECGKAFRQANLLKQHMFRHGNDKSFECPYCPLKFRCPNDVSKHKIIHEGIKRHICDICGDSFGKSNQLVLHKRYHNNEKPYQCECCKMRFHRLSTMRRHMLTHTGERPYKCIYCKRAFAQSNDHVKHLRTHLGENVYRCKLCPLRFRLASEMRLHFATHKNEDPETRERNIKCLKEAEAELLVRLQGQSQ